MFKSITAKNLFSWENLNYEINSGISQICGFNFDDNTSEGSGKSSIPNILCWVLYGSIPKSAKIDEVIREGCDGGSGQVFLITGESISRSRSPNDLCIRTSAGKVIKGKDVKETQQLINKLIGLDFNAFCQTVYFAQNYPNKFISSSETDKAQILSEIQDLTKLDKARKNAQDILKNEALALAGLETKIVAVESEAKKVASNLELLETFVVKFEEDKKERLKKLAVQINENENQQQNAKSYIEKINDMKAFSDQFNRLDEMLEHLEAKKLEYNVVLKTADATKRERDSLEKNLKSFEMTCANLQRKIANLSKQETSGLCPTCGRTASEESLQSHKEHLKEELEQLSKEYGEQYDHKRRLTDELQSFVLISPTELTKKRLEEVIKEIEAIKQNRENLKEMQRKYDQARNDIKELEIYYKTLQQDKQVIEASEPSEESNKMRHLEGQLVVLDETLGELRYKEEELRNRISKYEILKTGFKEVKQYIFQSLLNELSVKSTSLAADLFEIPVKIEFFNEDEEGSLSKIKTMVTLDGNERSLGLLSGGQLSRVTLAVDLALAAIVANRSEKALNFRILDEPFKNLSESSMAKVVELLSKLKGSTIVIEHNSLIKSIIHNTFNIEYRGGISHAA